MPVISFEGYILPLDVPGFGVLRIVFQWEYKDSPNNKKTPNLIYQYKFAHYLLNTSV